jgi:hypothetical protein
MGLGLFDNRRDFGRVGADEKEGWLQERWECCVDFPKKSGKKPPWTLLFAGPGSLPD